MNISLFQILNEERINGRDRKKLIFDLPQSLIDTELNQIIQQNTQNSVEVKKDKVNEKKNLLRKKILLLGGLL